MICVSNNTTKQLLAAVMTYPDVYPNRAGKLYYPDKFSVNLTTNAEFIAVYAVVVAVQFVNKFICLL